MVMGGDTYGKSLSGGAFANDHGVTISVDIDSLETEVPQLEALRDYVKDTLLPHLATVSEKIGDNGVAFGTFPGAMQAATLHGQYLTGVAQDLADLVNQLDADITATRAVIDRYRTTEARNAANAHDIDALFAGSTGTSGSTSAGPATPPPVNTGAGSTNPGAGSAGGGF